VRAAIAIGLLAALTAAAASVAAPNQSRQYVGWRYGPISGGLTMTTTAPALTCPGNNRDERRVVRGTYRVSFTGTSMRRTRAAADIGYNHAAGGPAGNTEPIAIRMRRSTDENVQVRTITFDDLGNPTCLITELVCVNSDTKRLRSASQRLNVWMRPGGRVRVIPPLPFYLLECDRLARDTNLLFNGGDVNAGPRFPLALFNRPRSLLRFASTTRGGGQTASGEAVRATLVHRASIGIVRMPGTPTARCKVC
jgi:hypothetical protein